MAIELLSAGAKLAWAVEVTAGTRPTIGYTRVRGVKSIPDFNPEPATHQVTDLSDTEWHRSIDGLKDVGGSVAFNCNHTEDFENDWDEVCDIYEESRTKGLRIWWQIWHPDLTRAFFFAGNPTRLGLGPLEVDAPVEINAYVTPVEVGGRLPKSATIQEPTTT